MITVPTGFFIPGVSGGDAYSTAVLADSPIAYWRLGEASGTTAADEKGSYPGTYAGTPTFSQTGVIAGNSAVRFPGSSDCMRTSNAALYPGSGNFTLECWFKSASSIGGSNVIWLAGRWDSFGFSERSFGMQIQGNTGSSNLWRCFVSTNGTSVVGASSAANESARPSTVWRHLVMVRDGSTLRFYIDGTEVATATGASGTLYNNTSSTPFRINGMGTSGHQARDSFFDEVAYYNFALSAARISAHYAAATP
jgi:hypothetical protein